MDRNTIIGLLLIAGIMIGYSVFMKPDREQLELARRRQDSLLINQQNRDSLVALQPDTANPAQLQQPASQSLQNDSLLALQFGSFSSAARGENTKLVIENDLMAVTIASRGGMVYSVNLKQFHKYDNSPLILFNGDSSLFGFDFFAQNRNISTSRFYFTPSVNGITKKGDTLMLSLRLYADSISYIEYLYTLPPNSYMLGFKALFVNMNRYLPGNMNSIDLHWTSYAPKIEKGEKNENTYTTVSYRYFQDETESIKPKNKQTEKDIATKLEWVGFKQQFFTSVLIPEQPFLNGKVGYEYFDESKSNYLKRFYLQSALPFSNTESVELPMAFYFGPNHFNTLKKYGHELNDLVSLGGNIIKWINLYLIIPIFNFLERFIGNYGIIILLLTLIIKVITLPLTYRSYLSMARMRVLKPQVDELNEKYAKATAMEKQQATMDLYKKAGVNPMGGCLPLLLQMPVLFAMYRFFPTSFELRQESFLWAKDLSTFDSIFSLPFTIPMYGDHISLFTLLMTVTTIWSVKQSNQGNMSNQQMPGMQSMTYIMPVMLMLVLNNFSSGLTYYLFVSNIFGIAQNEILKRAIDEKKLLKRIEDNKKKPVKKSSFQQRLEEMAKQRGYKLPKK